MKKGILDFLIKHADSSPVSFHMPGHKGAKIYKEYGYGDFLGKVMDCDITEIPGADNLFQAEDIIKSTQEKYADLYDAKKSYLLVNGTTTGLLASILATVPRGKKLIMARNCHKAVFNALGLADIEPVYAYPEIVPEYGIAGEVRAEVIERLLSENPDAEAVILPSPNYYGICSDIEKIAEAVHRAGKVLIVDQAHGAHLKFFDRFRAGSMDVLGMELPRAAEVQGADIVVNSTHKTLATFTQSAVMNVMSDRIDLEVLEDKLQTIESSSPSYLLMASLDINADLIAAHGEKLLARWRDNLEMFYRRAAETSGLKVMGMPRCGLEDAAHFDCTKLNLDMSALGISGAELEERLMEKDIFAELVTGDILMCMTGIGNVREDYERLLDALSEIAESAKSEKEEGVLSKNDDEMSIANRRCDSKINGVSADNKYPDFGRLEMCLVPKEKVHVKVRDAAGRVCAAPIIPYPPGIPLVCSGERITQEIADYVIALRMRGAKVIGINEAGEILVGK